MPNSIPRAAWCPLGLSEYTPISVDPRARAVGGIERDESSDPQSFLRLVAAAPRLPQRARAASRGATLSVLFHVLMVIAAMSAAMPSRPTPAPLPTAPSRQHVELPRLVFLQLPGPGGGGGGGGNRQPRPPSRAQAIGQDRFTVPVARTVVVTEKPKEATEPVQQQVVLDAKPLASGTMLVAGLPDAPASLPFSRGAGIGGGVGDGTGSGIGSGTGPGFGPGFGGGFEGGAYRLGSGVVPPRLLKEVKPNYTPDAMLRRIEGTVILEVVVSRNGTPLAIRVTRSLDSGGLDEAAVAAARDWRFTPGRIGDTPVDVVVTIAMDFNIR